MSIFINRTINLKKIKAIGLDMDYTIVRYNTEAFERLTFQEVLKKLVSLKSYPRKITKLKFDFERSIQGLIIDKKRGHLLKVSRFGKVKEAYHGLDPLDFKVQQQIYNNRIIDLGLPHFQSLDTSFSISNGILYSLLIQLKKEGTELPDFYNLADDIKEIIDICHADGTIKNQVSQNLEDYIIKDPEVAHLIERYKAYGKKLMIITNSDYNYTKLLMDYAINPFLQNHRDWKELFDITITLARKPSFFTNTSNFLKIDPLTGLMSNHFGPIDYGIFQGGSAEKLQKDLNLDGEEILYLGDHIYGDVVSIKKTFNWRTAMILGPLKDEIESLKRSSPIQQKINHFMQDKEILEKKINHIETQKFKAKKSGKKNDLSSLRKELNQIYAQIEKINSEISKLISEYRSHFNPYWGELMRAGQEESRMADQVEKYACLYMTHISDFFSHGPRTYFRPQKRILPHEMKYL